MANRYFEITPPYSNIQDIIRLCVGLFENQISSIDGTCMIIKLKDGDTQQHECLSRYPEYNLKQIQELLQTSKYTKDF